MLSLSKFFLFALLISPGIASCQDQHVNTYNDAQIECRACGCNKNKTKHGRKEKIRCGICAPAPQESTPQESSEETVESKCGCTPPPPQEVPQADELGLVNESGYSLECNCGKPPKRDVLVELIDQIEELTRAKNSGCPVTPPTPDCGCPKPTPPVPDCGCPVVTFTDASGTDVEVKCNCGKPPRRDHASEQTRAKNSSCPVTPPTPDCGCPKPTPPVPDCGCPTVALVEALKAEISSEQTKCSCNAPAQQDPEETTPHTKKTNSTDVLEGLAQTSYQAGNVIGAPSKKEKHQAVCNLVGSILHLAAQVTKKELKQPAAHNRSIMAITHQVLNNAKHEHIRSQLFTNKPYLIVLNSVEVPERNQLVSQLLSNPEDSNAFLKELFGAAHEYLSAHETTVQDALFAALEDLIQPEVADAQRALDNQATIEEFSIGNIKIRNASGQQVQVVVRAAQ